MSANVNPTHSGGATNGSERTIVVVCEDDGKRGLLASRVCDCFPEDAEVPTIVRAFNPHQAQQRLKTIKDSDAIVIVQDETRTDGVGLKSLTELAKQVSERPGSRFAVVTDRPTPSLGALTRDVPIAVILGPQDSFQTVLR